MLETRRVIAKIPRNSTAILTVFILEVVPSQLMQIKIEKQDSI